MDSFTDLVCFVKQPTYLDTSVHGCVCFADRSPPTDYIGPSYVWVEYHERFERGRGDSVSVNTENQVDIML